MQYPAPGLDGEGTDLAAALARAALTTARRLAGGATMWCVAPSWPEHARHIAVEFVHPVIVGKRAVPAVAVDDRDPVAALRSLAHSGDVLVAVSEADEPSVRDAMRRAPAWGVTTLWIGTGTRPPPGAADCVLWLDDPGPFARYDGSLVLLFHVLWELTHVCFEHPGLLTGEPCVDDASCVTCSDEGRPAEVLEGSSAHTVAVRSARGVETIDTTLVGPVVAGDLVLVHAGTAIAVLAESSP